MTEFTSPYNLEISTSPRGLAILYKTLLARKLSKSEDGRYRPKHVIFSIANKHHHLSIFYSCVLTEFTPPYSLEISTSPRGLDILYKTLLARKLSKPEDSRYRPKHVDFQLLINTII